MKELIKITEQNGEKLVSARDLYDYLGIYERFSKWFDRMVSYNLQEGVDYTPYQMVHPQNNQEIQDYALTLDCAKIISMLQRNEKGDFARRYFIEVEKQAKEYFSQLSPAEQLLHNAQLLVAQEKRLSEHDNRIKILEAKTTTRPDYFTIVGYATLQGMSVGLKMAAALGKRAMAICNQKGITTETVPDPRFGVVRMYPKHVLDQVFEMAVS